MTSRIITTTEVAKALSLSRQRVVYLARKGRIPGARKLTWCWVFSTPVVVTPPKRRQRLGLQKE